MTENKTIPAWKPTTEGTVLRGTVAKINERDLVNEYGAQDYKQVILADEDGNLTAVNCIGTSLRKQIDWVDPQVGDDLLIGYIGVRESAAGNKFKKFNMRKVIAETNTAA